MKGDIGTSTSTLTQNLKYYTQLQGRRINMATVTESVSSFFLELYYEQTETS